MTLIHTGDFHGHLVPRADVRGAVDGRAIGTVGGLARVATVVKAIRSEAPGALLINTGDTIQGSAEALYTRGEALVTVVNMLGVDAFAPGNWEFVYGTDRFLELFTAPRARMQWNTIETSAIRASSRTPAAFVATCIAVVYGPCASTRVTPPRKNQTRVTNICCHRARLVCR